MLDGKPASKTITLIFFCSWHNTSQDFDYQCRNYLSGEKFVGTDLPVNGTPEKRGETLLHGTFGGTADAPRATMFAIWNLLYFRTDMIRNALS
jgi:hypothetical protein